MGYNNSIMNDQYKEAQLLLFSMLGDRELTNSWWNTPNKGFDGKLPIDIWTDNPQLVMNYLYRHANGEW
jgi:hypothetical protein